jgi:hypothetical protein
VSDAYNLANMAVPRRSAADVQPFAHVAQFGLQ